MKKNERILLVIALCLVGAFLLSWGTGTKGGKSSLRGAPPEAVPEFPELPRLDGVYIVAYAEKGINFIETPKRLRDPFGTYVLHDDTESSGQFKLTGIFNDGGERYAILSWKESRNGVMKDMKEIVPEDGWVKGWWVEEIQEKGVWMQKDEERRFFELHKKLGNGNGSTGVE